MFSADLYMNKPLSLSRYLFTDSRPQCWREIDRRQWRQVALLFPA